MVQEMKQSKTIQRPSILKPVQPPKRENSNDGYMSQGISQSDDNSIRLSNVKGPINVRKISPAMASVATNSKNPASFE